MSAKLAQADVRRLPLADNSIDLIFTDPPYLEKFIPAYGWLSAEAARVLKPGGFCLAMAGCAGRAVISRSGKIYLPSDHGQHQGNLDTYPKTVREGSARDHADGAGKTERIGGEIIGGL